MGRVVYWFRGTDAQKSHIRFWLIAVAVAETLMLVFEKYLWFFYFAIALLFLGGFLLRVLKVYPGKEEPVVLDFLGTVLALLFASAAYFIVHGTVRIFLILTSSLIILPHLVYIVMNKDI